MGEEMSFENYSGGERVRITIAIAEGLASLQSSVGFRIMDEMITGLSSEMIFDFTEVLLRLQNKYSQMLMISHLEEVKELFSEKIIVNKINGISKITI